MQTHRRRPAGSSATVLSVLDDHEIAALRVDAESEGPVVCLWPDEAEVPAGVGDGLEQVATRRAVAVLRHGPLTTHLVDCRGVAHVTGTVDVDAVVRSVVRDLADTPAGLHEVRLDVEGTVLDTASRC